MFIMGSICNVIESCHASMQAWNFKSIMHVKWIFDDGLDIFMPFTIRLIQIYGCQIRLDFYMKKTSKLAYIIINMSNVIFITKELFFLQ